MPLNAEITALPEAIDLPLPRHIWWPWTEPAGRVGFEGLFEARESSPAFLYVACSGSYRCWLDETEIPVRESHLPSWRAMHCHPLQLQPGPHRLRFSAEGIPPAPGGAVFKDGVVSGSAPLALPFLMACLDWQEAGLPRRAASGADWTMLRDPLSGAQNWSGPDSRPAWAFDGVWSEPWGLPANAPQDFCRLTTGWSQVNKRSLDQLALLAPGAAALGARIQARPDGSLEIQPALPYPISMPDLRQTLPRQEWYRTREAHSLINNTWLDLFEPRCAHAVFDAGGETFARLRVTLRSGGPAILALSTGESFNEVQRYARRVTDIFQLADGESFSTSPTGFRYAKVMALSAGAGPVQLDPLELQEVTYPVECRGQFACSDPGLNAIFDLSVRTLHLCMQNEIWDGIKRDQLPWMGDLYTEALASYLLFGDYRLVGRTLAVLADLGPGPERPLEQRRSPGLYAIWRTASGDINGIPSYTLWYLVGLWDYWQHSGDLELIGQFRAELSAALDHLASWVGDDGLWRLRSGWDFVDWAPLTPAERWMYCHLLAYRALGGGMELLEALGQPVTAYAALRERMAAAARREWLEAGGFGAAHHANAQAICSGILSPLESSALFQDLLQPDPPLSMTYWHRYLDLTAAQRVDAIPWGLEYIRRHWGRALEVGMSTLWEAFDPAWIGPDPHALSMVGAGYARYGGYETSQCHGWSCGPAIWLLNAVLGITPAEPGFRAFHFRPRLGDLDWAEGALPTPHGDIRVRLERRPGQKPLARLHAPAGLEVRISAADRAEWDLDLG